MGMLLIILILLVVVAIATISAFFYVIPFDLLMSAYASNVKVGILAIIGLKLKKIPPSKIILPLIKASKAGLKVNVKELESHFLAGGNVDNVIAALVASQGADMHLAFEKVAAIDLAGRDVLEAVRMSVTPKVIVTPSVSAVAKNGIEVLLKAKVTIRANLEKLIGGAGEDTILAKVGEGIISTVGALDSHKEVLENPDAISKVVEAKNLDTGTAFKILSVDISDVDVGRNIGAQIQTDLAEADKKIAQAKAEERRTMAIAREQEMKADVQQMRASVVQAEAQVLQAEAQIPNALVYAFRTGKIGVMDYYNMQNIIADTHMRASIATDGSAGTHIPDMRAKMAILKSKYQHLFIQS